MRNLEITGLVAKLKPQTVRVNISSTFPIRSKCKFCMKGPQYYIIQKRPIKWIDPKDIKIIFDQVAKYTKRMTQDFYLPESPKHFHAMGAFSCPVFYKKYDPSLHAKRGIMCYDDVIEMLLCACGFTGWAFTQKSSVLRSEITNRKARYKYPRKFDDWF